MTIAGIWENEYGSRMSLVAKDAAISGVYESTTGATGRYLVAGWQSASKATSAAGQPVALTIGWHSIAGGPPDAGWHWTSALGGQISVENGQELLIVTHLLVATSGFAGLCQHGLYTDKLTYRRVSDVSPTQHTPFQRTEVIANRLAGIWNTADDMTLDLQVFRERSENIGFITGTLISSAGTLEVTGFTDIDTALDATGLQSIALSAVDRTQNTTIALGGWIDDATGIMTLQSLTNRATTAVNTWLQTTLWPLHFNRRGTA